MIADPARAPRRGRCWSSPARDSAEGPGAATSAAATGTLVALAENLGGSRHERTLIFASTDGGTDGASGAPRARRRRSAPRGRSTPRVVISQPGARSLGAPYVIASGTEPESPSAAARRNGARDRRRRSSASATTGPGAWAGLRASPSRSGSASRRRCAAPGSRRSRSRRPASARFPPSEAAGRLDRDAAALRRDDALGLLLTLDEAERAPGEGPEDYVRLGDNLIPGWTLSLLAITLIAAGAARRRRHLAARAPRPTGARGARSLGARAGPAAAAGAAARLSARAGRAVPDPALPLRPRPLPAGRRGARSPSSCSPPPFVLAALLVRPMRTPLDSEPHTLAAAAGLLSGGALVGDLAAQPLPGAAARPRRSRLVAAGPRRRAAAGAADRAAAAALAAARVRRLRLRVGPARPRPDGALAPAAADRGRPDRLRHLAALVRDARRADRLRLAAGARGRHARCRGPPMRRSRGPARYAPRLLGATPLRIAHRR